MNNLDLKNLQIPSIEEIAGIAENIPQISQKINSDSLKHRERKRTTEIIAIASIILLIISFLISTGFKITGSEVVKEIKLRNGYLAAVCGEENLNRLFSENGFNIDQSKSNQKYTD